MTERVLGPTGSPRRRWTLLLPLALVSLLAAFYIPSASAVHDFTGLGDGSVFELDNNAFDDATVPGTPPTNSGDDWSTLLGGTPANPAGSADEQTAVPVTDPVNFANDDTFCGGTKEKDDIAAWKWCNNAASNDKNDIEHAYSAIYTVPSGASGQCGGQSCAGDKVLYVGADRYANNGDSGLGFMFLQTGLGKNACPVPSTGCTFNDGAGGTPHHTNGDLYVVSQFTGGGQGVTVDFYVWAGGNSGSWQLDTSGVDCDASSANDIACATVFGDGDNKTNGSEQSPWPFTTKFPGTGGATQFAEGTFFEGGVDLTARNITGCFKSILVDTSQSQNINESDQDFVSAPFEGCTSDLTTTPSVTSVTLPTTDTLDPSSVTVHDTAVLGVTGVPSFVGSIAFHLCGPFPAADTTSNCFGTGGANIGSVPANVPGSYDSPTSPTFTKITKAGRYCWRADFTSTTAGVPSSSDPNNATNLSECFTVSPVTPLLTTQAVKADGTAQGTTKVPFGQAVYDKGTLDGTANQPGKGGLGDGSINPTTAGGPALGTITFKLYGPGIANCTTLATDFPTAGITVDVTAGDGTYPSANPSTVTFVPKAPGDYFWKASYSGDSPNTNASGEHNSDCTVSSEKVTVEQVPTNIKTRQSWFPNDTATVSAASGTLGASGSVAFSLYNNTTCSGSAFYSETRTVTGGIASEEVGTTNTTVPITTLYPDTAGTIVSYSWKVVYTPNASDTAHTGKQSACNAEHFSITYTNDNGPGTNLP